MVALKGLFVIWATVAVLTFCAWGFVDLIKTITLLFIPKED